MSRNIRLPNDARVFQRDPSGVIINTGKWVPEGAIVPVADDFVIVNYNHGKRYALEFMAEGEKCYLLVGEVRIPEHQLH